MQQLLGNVTMPYLHNARQREGTLHDDSQPMIYDFDFFLNQIKQEGCGIIMMGLLRTDGNADVRCTGAASFAANIGARISVGSLGCCCFCIGLFHYSKGASAFIRVFIKSSSNAFFPILFPFSVSVPISCFRFLFCGVRGGVSELWWSSYYSFFRALACIIRNPRHPLKYLVCLPPVL